MYSSELAQDASRVVPPDGLWIGTLGGNGLIGLILLYLILELPVMLFLRRFPVELWCDPRVAPAAVAATLLAIYMVDCLANAFVNVVYISLAGGLIGIGPKHFGVSPARLYKARRMANQSSCELGPNAVQTVLGPGVKTNEQSDYDPSPLVAGRIAAVEHYRKLGRSLKCEARWADAELALQQALDLLIELRGRQSGLPDLHRRWCDCANDLAWLLLITPDSRGYARAMALATQVVGEYPDDHVYWNTLGLAHLRNGGSTGAVAALHRAITLGSEENPFNHVFLAMAHARLGDRQQAQHSLAQAMLLREQDYLNHRELTCFCDEARAVVGTEPQAAPADT